MNKKVNVNYKNPCLRLIARDSKKEDIEVVVFAVIDFLLNNIIAITKIKSRLSISIKKAK